MERCPVEHAVDEARGDEEARRAMHEPPALVSAEDATNLADTGCVVRRPYDAAKRRRDNRLPARQDRPHDQCHEADRTDRAQRSAQRGAVWAARQQNVRSQQDQTGDRNAAMPDRSPVDPVEPFLDPWKRADEDEGDREQQDRLRTQELSDIASGRFSRGSSDEPHEAPDAHEEHDRRGPDFPSDEAPAHTEHATPSPDCVRASSTQWSAPSLWLTRRASPRAA